MNNDVPVHSEEKRGGSSLLRVLEFTAQKTLELANANSVLGEKIELDGMTVIPVSKLSVGFAGGGADITDANRKKKQNPAGSGAMVTLTPMSFLVIQGQEARMLTVAQESKGGILTPELLHAVAEQAKSLFSKEKPPKKSG